MKKNITLVAITGGPCSGKTTFLEAAEGMLAEHGVKAVIMPEVATTLITNGLRPNPDEWKTSNDFQSHLLRISVANEDNLLAAIASLRTEQPVVLLCDRGLLDGMAYVGRTTFLEIIESLGLNLAQMRNRYNGVIHLVTAADGAEEFYTLENNSARTETPEQARELDAVTQRCWLGHPHHQIIGNETYFNGKIKRAIQALKRILDMPAQREIERKWSLSGFSRSLIPDSAHMSEITQTYLTSTDPQVERRVRARNADGVTLYSYTEKTPTDNPMVRTEHERDITMSEYETLLQEADPELIQIRKLRFCFPFKNQLLELDVYQGKHEGLVVVEVELQEETIRVILPDSWSYTEVTNDTRYKNHSLAAGEFIN